MSAIFRTSRLPLAIFFLATNALPFLCCERVSVITCEFAFADDDGEGPALELAYDRGATAPANELFRSQTAARKLMSQAMSQAITPRVGMRPSLLARQTLASVTGKYNIPTAAESPGDSCDTPR